LVNRALTLASNASYVRKTRRFRKAGGRCGYWALTAGGASCDGPPGH
jgi:hypothetical protein